MSEITKEEIKAWCKPTIVNQKCLSNHKSLEEQKIKQTKKSCKARKCTGLGIGTKWQIF